MRIQKISLLAAIMISIVAMSYSNKRFTTLSFTWSGTDFFMGMGSGPLDDEDKWSVSVNTTCNGTGKMCEVVAAYSGSPSQPIGEQDIISAVKAKYDALAAQFPASTFTDNYTFSVLYIYGVQVDFTIRLKS
jgi:hypothetical protein